MSVKARERCAVTVWPMEEEGWIVRADTEWEARGAVAEWLVAEAGPVTSVEAAGRVAGMRCTEPGWWRWTPCNPRSCFAGIQHRPGHLQAAAGPGPGVWRGVAVDIPGWTP